MTRTRRDKGAVLIIALIFAVIIATFCMTSLMVSTMESQGTHAAVQRDKAFFVASAGIQDQFKSLNDLMAGASLTEPFKGFEGLEDTTPIENRTLMSGELAIGEYTVAVNSITPISEWERDVAITSTGWVPAEGHPKAHRQSVTAVVRLGLGRSEVFDYVYFINNWGWYYGSTIIANGNVRANGQFDFGNYGSTINGLPRYGDLTDGKFSDELDKGGVYAGWNIVGDGRVGGASGSSDSMHAFVDQLPMPNLTDLTLYEKMAKTNNSEIKIDGKVVANAVIGDEPSEKGNLFLLGTKDAPIELNGPVVVRGDLIIQGYVKGKGSLYVQGNIYIAGNLMYSNPVGATPTDKDKQSLESWVSSNEGADALGLFAREHIVVGDYTSSNWQSSVSKWVYDKRNGSEEDAGEDGIPNTRAGRDGIMGTADDDVLEGDGKFTVETYTIEDKRDGKIPEGFNVGDGIPGTGEDIDGDGKYDRGTQMSEFDVKSPLNQAQWEGNFPKTNGNMNFSELCNNGLKINRLDGAFYTNHTFAMLTLDYSNDLKINGTLVSRNEAIVYGTKHAIFNYDLRLLEEDNPHGLQLPRTWQPMRMVMWRSN